MGAVAAILTVMSAAFYLAGRDRGGEPYWASWWVAHAVLAAALVLFMFEARLPALLVALLPNGLLVLGFALRWRAAREFAARPAHLAAVWGPSAFFAFLCLLPPILGSFGAIFTLTNIMLTVLAGMTAWEFWRDRGDGMASRLGLTLAYALIAGSFAVRVGQGFLEGGRMEQYLPLDAMLTAHLMVSVVHAAMSGAFALSLAFERSAVRLREAAMQDALTGLLNRGAFETFLRGELDGPRKRDLVVAIVDIDHFKMINDSHGHGAGDAAIRQTAAALAGSVRDGDLVARIGGEEFAVVLWDVPAEDLEDSAERLRRAIEDLRIEYEGATIRLTASIGCCRVEGGGCDFDTIMRIADAGLYRAKNEGRNRVSPAAA
jgi:diguanylate cyclase (GGDEF)-like protein